MQRYGKCMNGGERTPSVEEGLPAIRRVNLDVQGARDVTTEAPRPVVILLGMHRSGTSLLSNVLHILGVDMADTTDHVSPKNAGGFWERPELVAIHDEILAAIGRPIAQPSHVLPLPPAWWRNKDVQALKPKLVDYVRSQLAKSSNPWGFKDPRTCRLLPLWQEVFRELNLEPVYVNAVRNPAEASVSMSQKSPARKMSVANGELMWLSYNYDIARYVLAKSPSILIDYDEWFAAPTEMARRLAQQLGIGRDLSDEDLAECMNSLVRPDYRHQVDGKAGVASGLPIATMLYEAMTAGNPPSESDVRHLRAQLRLVDLFFKSLAPVAHDLDQLTASHAALAAEATELRAEHAETARLLEAANVTNQEGAAGQRQLSAEVAAVRAELGAGVGKAGHEPRSLTDKIAALVSESAQHKADIATAKQEADELRRTIETQQARLAAETLERQGLEERLANETSEHERLLDTVQTERRTSVAQQRNRARKMIEAARQWRDAYHAEHGDDDARLASAEAAKELVQALAAVEQKLTLAEDLNARFIEEIEARDRTLAKLWKDQAERLPGRVEGAVSFQWPAEGNLEVSSQIDEVGGRGISGQVLIAGRPEIVPVVELLANGTLILAETCLAEGALEDRAPDEPWRFLVPFSRIAPEFGGQEVSVRLAGFGQELGRTKLPDDLSRFHAPPAVVAADVLGGTPAEAAEYQAWVRHHESVEEADLARQYRKKRKRTGPKLVVLVIGEEREALKRTVGSLRDQVYGDWEALCIGAGKDIEAQDPRLRAVAEADADSALDLYAEEALITFVEAGDILSPTAFLHLIEAAASNPEFSLIYSDEDRFDPETGLRAFPYLKAQWSPDLGFAQDYVSRLAVIPRKQLDKVPLSALDLFEMTVRAALQDGEHVVHLPFVLYHRDASNASRSVDLTDTVNAILGSNAQFTGAQAKRAPDGRVKIHWPIPDPAPRVSLIVPTRDRADLLRVVVDGFLHETRYKNLEIIIADNDSQEEDSKSFLAKVATHPRVQVVPVPGEFNYSKINNEAARHATGSLIGLMNNDLKVLDPDWLGEMVSHAVRPDVGIVGAKLLHGDGTVQHAGVTLGIGLASHLYKSFPGGAGGRQGRLVTPQDLSAVTAACLLMRRDVWDEVGGLDEDFPVAYNDVDLCLKVRAAGYRILWTPDALVYHLESQSRGKDVTPAKRERLSKDKNRLIERWGALLDSDPFHSPNFSSKHVDARLAFPPRVAAVWQSSPDAQ
jgi:GT2 family glycosyltransferase